MKFRYFIMMIIALSLLVLPACTRSASTAIPVTVAPSIENSAAVSTQEEVVPKVISPTPKPTQPKETEAEKKPEPTSTPQAVSTAVPSYSTGIGTAEYNYATDATLSVTASAPAFQVFSGYDDEYPTFGIRGVVYNSSVTIQANSFPANETYTVTMGRADTNGVGFVEVGTFETGEGGSSYVTLNIPDTLMYVGTIAIRIDFSDGNYALNWFYNITTN